MNQAELKGFVIERHVDGVWKNECVTLDNKPVTFETKPHADEFFNACRPNLQPGNYRIQAVS